jgi:hypothetical protein
LLTLVLLGALLDALVGALVLVLGALVLVLGSLVLGMLVGADDPAGTPPAPLEALWAYSLGRATLRGYCAAAG